MYQNYLHFIATSVLLFQIYYQGFVALFLSTNIIFASSTILFLVKTLTAEESKKLAKL